MNPTAFITPSLPLRTACPLSLPSSTSSVRSHRKVYVPTLSISKSPEEKNNSAAVEDKANDTNTTTPSTTTSSSPSSSSPSSKTKEKYVPKPSAPFKSSATWSPAFFPGFGRKGVGSDPGWDLRPKSMRAETQTKKEPITCDSCKSTGKMTCSFCEGVTFKTIEGKELKCPACDNQKTITCSACFGTCKQIELTDNWWVRGIGAMFKDK